MIKIHSLPDTMLAYLEDMTASTLCCHHSLLIKLVNRRGNRVRKKGAPLLQMDAVISSPDW